MVKDIKWLKVAQAIANEFSRCKKRKVGSLIVGVNGEIVSTGYNFHPRHTTKDDVCLREGIETGTQMATGYCVHAEANAMIYADFHRMQDATLYVTCAPCIICARLILQSGVKRLVYYSDNRLDGIELIKELRPDFMITCYEKDGAKYSISGDT